jgi:ABC-type uncharacterized transport system fused permease/ATPase subunit
MIKLKSREWLTHHLFGEWLKPPSLSDSPARAKSASIRTSAFMKTPVG